MKQIEELFGANLVDKDFEQVSTKEVLGGKMIGIYFGASW